MIDYLWNMIMTKGVAPENYREMPFHINGTDINIVGMARPDRGGHDIDESMAYVKEQKIDVILSLDWKEKYQQAANKYDISYISKQIPDFEPPTIKQCDEIYQMVSAYTQQGKRIAVHCGAGHGRTGTVLVALKMKELVAKEPSFAMQNSKSTMARVGHYGGNKFINCTPLVRAAIEEIRSARDSKGSVEIGKQIEMLCEYEAHLMAESQQKKIDLNGVGISPNHEIIKITNDAINILKDELKNANFLRRIILNQKITTLSQSIISFTGEKNSASADTKLNNLISSIHNIKPGSIHDNVQKNNLTTLQDSLGEKIPKKTINDIIISFAMPLYKAISNFSKPMEKAELATASHVTPMSTAPIETTVKNSIRPLPLTPSEKTAQEIPALAASKEKVNNNLGTLLEKNTLSTLDTTQKHHVTLTRMPSITREDSAAHPMMTSMSSTVTLTPHLTNTAPVPSPASTSAIEEEHHHNNKLN